MFGGYFMRKLVYFLLLQLYVTADSGNWFNIRNINKKGENIELFNWSEELRTENAEYESMKKTSEIPAKLRAVIEKNIDKSSGMNFETYLDILEFELLMQISHVDKNIWFNNFLISKGIDPMEELIDGKYYVTKDFKLIDSDNFSKNKINYEQDRFFNNKRWQNIIKKIDALLEKREKDFRKFNVVWF